MYCKFSSEGPWWRCGQHIGTPWLKVLSPYSLHWRVCPIDDLNPWWDVNLFFYNCPFSSFYFSKWWSRVGIPAWFTYSCTCCVRLSRWGWEWVVSGHMSEWTFGSCLHGDIARRGTEWRVWRWRAGFPFLSLVLFVLQPALLINTLKPPWGCYICPSTLSSPPLSFCTLYSSCQQGRRL